MKQVTTSKPKQEVTVSPTTQLPTHAPEKEKMDKETQQILVDDRVSTGG